MNMRRRMLNKGVVLIEALISVVVLGIGMVALAQLQGTLVAGSGLSKARTEAVQLGQAKIEELRNLAIQTQHTNIAAGNDTVDGVNAQFARAWTVSGTSAKSIEVSVSWTDMTNVSQTVKVSGIVTWDDPKLAVNLASPLTGGSVETPSGSARMGGDNDYSEGIPQGATDNGDGTHTYTSTDANGNAVTELIDSGTGKVLMTIDDGTAFSTVTGSVFIDAANSVSASVVYVMASDAVYCKRSINDPLSKLPVGATGNNIKYYYFDYKCYVGKGWYGNIGIVRTDNANSNDRVCVGDPTASDSGTSTSRHPVLSTTRMYRGYTSTDAASATSTGIGVDVADNSYTAVSYTKHHFLLTRITGNPSDGDCVAPMSKTSPSPLARQVGDADTTHPGGFFCLSGNCPDSLPTGDAPTTTISGSITLLLNTGGPSGRATVTNMAVQGGTCTVSGTSYSCTIDWTGWAGETWAGDITVTVGDDDFLCETGTGEDFAGSIVDADSDGVYETLRYSGIPPSQTQMTGQDFTVRDDSQACPSP